MHQAGSGTKGPRRKSQAVERAIAPERVSESCRDGVASLGTEEGRRRTLEEHRAGARRRRSPGRFCRGIAGGYASNTISRVPSVRLSGEASNHVVSPITPCRFPAFVHRPCRWTPRVFRRARVRGRTRRGTVRQAQPRHRRHRRAGRGEPQGPQGPKHRRALRRRRETGREGLRRVSASEAVHRLSEDVRRTREGDRRCRGQHARPHALSSRMVGDRTRQARVSREAPRP